MHIKPSLIQDLAKSIPRDFTIGTATSSWQIEGDSASRGSSVWDDWAKIPGNIKDGATADPANEHIARYKDDVQMLKWLGVDAYRFSISWPRVLDIQTGKPRSQGLDFYSRLIDELLANGIKPVLTIYHWDLPSELQNKGGWSWHGISDSFADYTELLAKNYVDRVDRWATLNEPWVVAFLGYAANIHAPGLSDPARGFKAAYEQLVAHGKAMDVLRGYNAPNAGTVLNLTSVVSDFDQCAEAVNHVDMIQNRIWLDMLSGRGIMPETIARTSKFTDWSFVDQSELNRMGQKIDWLGINYYTPARIAPAEYKTGAVLGQGNEAYPGTPDNVSFVSGEPKTAMGWEIHPPSLLEMLKQTSQRLPGVPLYITENGGAFDDELVSGEVHDEMRTKYYFDHIETCIQAIAEGIDLRGYFAWSLMDNIEWAEGLEKRFGIFYVDFKTQQRTAKDSAKLIRSLIQQRDA